MGNFTGQNVVDITLKRQSDVVIKKILAVNANVAFPEGTESLEVGQVLVTTNGVDFSVPLEDAEPNGILCESMIEPGMVEVLVCGVVRQKYLDGLEDAHKMHLFNNKIILK